MVFLFSFISLFKKISRKWRGYFYNLFLKLKYFLFMNFLEDVHEHTWINKKFQIFFVHEFPWGLSWMSMEEFRTRIVVEKLSDFFTRDLKKFTFNNLIIYLQLCLWVCNTPLSLRCHVTSCDLPWQAVTSHAQTVTRKGFKCKAVTCQAIPNWKIFKYFQGKPVTWCDIFIKKN